MNSLKRALCAVIAIAALVSLAGCSEAGGPEAVVATVDGVEIYKWEIDYYYEQRAPYYEGYAESLGLDLENDPDDIKMVNEGILEVLIKDTAMTLYAKELGYELTDEERAEVEAAFAESKKASIEAYASEYDGDLVKGEEAYNKAVKESHMTEEFMLESQYNAKVRDKFNADLYADITVDEETVLNFYNSDVEADKASYTADRASYENDNAYDSYTVLYHPADYHRFKQILIAMPSETTETLNNLYSQITNANTELAILSIQKGDGDSSVLRLKEQVAELNEQLATARAEGLAQIQARADEVLALVKAGEDFDELVAQYGEDEGMKSAPYRDYGYFASADSAETSILPALRDAAMALSTVGETTDELIVTDLGCHILQLVQIIDEGPRPLEEVREFIEGVFKQSQQTPIFDETAAKAMESREIVRYTDRL